MKKENLKSRLEKTKEATLDFFELPIDDLAKRYAPSKWSVQQLLHHLADSETILYERIRRILSGPEQVLWTFDQDRFNEGLDYANFPLEINRNIYQAVRRSAIYLLDKHFDEKKDLIFIHSKTGKRTLGDAFQKIAWHNEHHLVHIRQALKFG